MYNLDNDVDMDAFTSEVAEAISSQNSPEKVLGSNSSGVMKVSDSSNMKTFPNSYVGKRSS